MSNRNLIALIAAVSAIVGVFSIIYAEPLVWRLGGGAQSEFIKSLGPLFGLWLLLVRFVSLFILPLALAYLSIWIIIGALKRERVAYISIAGLLIAVFVLPLDTIADKSYRGYRDYFGSQSRGWKIDEYAGCSKFKEPIQYTDKEFSDHWKEDSEKYSFDEVDIDGVMLSQCAPGKIRDASEEVIRYQNRFLNREFSVLNPNWVPNEPVVMREMVDAASLKLYGSRIGLQGTENIDTSNWKAESNKEIVFSFKYPSGSKITNEGNCYRVEYELGFVIFLLPVEGDMRCGARTGVGALPDNTDVTDRLLIQGKEYLAPGFRAIMDTKGEMFYKPETRYFYDFHHMLDADYCVERCLRIGYGIYKETPAPLQRGDVDKTMDTLRAIVESLKYEKEL